jgi:hypothetical protein
LLSWAVAGALAFTFVQAVAFIGGALACMAWFAFPSGLSAETAMAQLAGIYFGNAWHLPAAWASWVGFLVGLAVALTRGPHAAQTEA